MKQSKTNCLINPSIDELLERVENKYILSLLVSKRARSLFDGDAPLINEYHINKVTTAIDEIYQDRVTVSPNLNQNIED